MKRIEVHSHRVPGALGQAQAGEERFRDLVEAGADGVLVVGRDGTICLANSAASALLGRDGQELVGQPFGVPVVPGETTVVDIPRVDGGIRVAEMRADATTWNGEPAYLAALRDITERKQAEDAASEALATLRSFYDGASMMMGVVELVGEDLLYISSNTAMASFFNVKPEELAGQLAGRLGVAPETLALWSERSREAERSGTATRFEYQSETPSGLSWLSATVGFIGKSDMGRARFSFVVEDVTERRRADEALRDSDRRKDEFLAMLAHELRNPLAVVGNAVHLLRRGEEHREWAGGMIERQVKHLGRLIDDLLDVSRISRGKIQLRIERLDATTTLRGAVESVRRLIEQREHELIVSLPADGLWVDADPTRLEQVVVNLLTNAAKYTEPGGHIWLSAQREGGNIVIRVRDDGLGISPERLPEMFLLFAQGERSIARSEGGLGIGLTLVKGLVEMHGGSVTAWSEGADRGSLFSVCLPAAGAEYQALATPCPSSGKPSQTLRVLVVDDHREGAGLMVTLLQQSGFEAQAAYDGPTGLATARAFRPHVILLDIGLPGMDGYQVAEAIRREPGFEKLRVIVVSGYGEEQARRRSQEAGCTLHLVKPVDIESLLNLLNHPDPEDDSGQEPR